MYWILTSHSFTPLIAFVLRVRKMIYGTTHRRPSRKGGDSLYATHMEVWVHCAVEILTRKQLVTRKQLLATHFIKVTSLMMKRRKGEQLLTTYFKKHMS